MKTALPPDMMRSMEASAPASGKVSPKWGGFFRSLAGRVVFWRRGPSATRNPLERELVRRLDTFLLTFGCLSQVIKYLDQTNIATAYVSGMKEDLELHGNELNYFITCFNAAYCVMLVPSLVIITWLRPSWWLPSLEIGWGLMTGLIALSKNAKQIYVLRVFVGLFESSAWPGMMMLLMFWYTPMEMAKRMGLLHSCQVIGYMMSAGLQTALLKTLDGAHGIAGWRWLFIINAAMTIAVGLVGFFMLPDYPSHPNPRAFWFSAKHARMAQERLERHDRADVKSISWAALKRVLTMWLAYFLPALFTATTLAQYSYSFFNLFLKSLKDSDGTPTWNASQVNSITIAFGAMAVLSICFWGILSDRLQTRWTLLVAQAVIGLVPAITMSVWTRHPTSTPLSAAYASYFISSLSIGTAPLTLSWLSDLFPHDPDARTLILGFSTAVMYSFIAWSQVLIWPAKEAPYYKCGWQVCIGLWILVLTMIVFLRRVEVKYLGRTRTSRSSRSWNQDGNGASDDIAEDAPGHKASGRETRIGIFAKD